MPGNCINRSKLFSINFLEILHKTKNSFLRCQPSYFALANICLQRHDSFFIFILLLSSDKVSNNKVFSNTLPFYNCN